MKISRKKKEQRAKLLTLLSIIIALCAIIGFVSIITINGRQTAAKAAASPSAAPTPSKEAQEAAASATPEALVIIPGLLAYVEKNPDTVGLIKVPNTIIDYPVVYSGDNEYYLTRNFDQVESPEGAIFMDFRCDIRDFSKTRNIILYGHRMRDGTMFKPLVNYEDEAFFYDNRIIRFDTLYDTYEWEVFTVFETYTDFYYIDTYFPTDEKWLAFLETCHSLSAFETETKFYPTDIILTLSTCTANKNKRLVVMAKLKH